MTNQSLTRRISSAIADFHRRHREGPGLVVRVLQWLFHALSTETQLYLAQEATVGMAAASMTAKDRWGDAGNVQVDGNEVRVGVNAGEKFVVLGRGRSWKTAFDDAARRGRGNRA